MSIEESKSLHPTKEVFGYDSNLVDALRRIQESRREGAHEILNRYKDWIANAPYCRHLCFLDITFFPQPRFLGLGNAPIEKADTFIVAPRATKEERGEANIQANALIYEGILSSYLSSENTIAGHFLFMAGLPHCDGCSSRNKSSSKNVLDPMKKWELEDFWKDCETCPNVENGFLIDEIQKPGAEGTTGSPNQEPLGSEDFDIRYRLSEEIPNVAKKASKEALGDMWESWKSGFKPTTLSSHMKRNLRWLAAIPVGHRIKERPSKFMLIATVFLGFDESLRKNDVAECVRYILLHMYEANAAGLSRRLGEEFGADRAINIFSHQIREIAVGAGSRWLMKPGEWREAKKKLCREFPEHFKSDQYRIAPVPRLYSGLQTALCFWTQSSRWQDHFEIDKKIELPRTFKDLLERAFDCALDAYFVGEVRGKSLQDHGELMKVWKQIPGGELRGIDERKFHLHYRSDASEALQGIQVQGGGREASGNKLEATLCDFLRLFAAIFDNYLRRGVEPVEIEAQVERQQLALVFSNKKRKEMTPDGSNDRPGMTGKEVIEYICEQRLKGRVFWPSQKEIDNFGNPFKLRLTLPLEQVRSDGGGS